MAMLDKVGKAALHGAGLSVVCALAAYWAVKIITPPPTVAPPPLAAAPCRNENGAFVTPQAKALGASRQKKSNVSQEDSGPGPR